MIEVNFAETIFLGNFFQDMGRIAEPFSGMHTGLLPKL